MENRLEEINTLFKEMGALNYKLMYPKLMQMGFYPGQPILLDIIHTFPGISQAKLAKLAHKEPATITTMINRMNDIIIRKPDKDDKRIIRLYLSLKGNESYEQLKQIESETSKIMFNEFTEVELDKLQEYLIKIKNNIDKELI